MPRIHAVLRLAALLHLPSFAQFDAQHLAPSPDPSIVQRHASPELRLYPVIANTAFQDSARSIARAVPMNKALEDGRLKINEHAQGATVNTLQATNTSNDTIYLMQGEVVIGGKQDRMLARDVLVPPHATIDIAAFCVEHGRWTEEAEGGSFKSTIGVAAQDVRKAAAVDQEQTRVWGAVSYYMTASDVASPSGSYAHLQENKDFGARRDALRSRSIGLPAACIGMVGVVAVSGDRVIGCDVFASEALFKQAYPQLLEAYIAEALNNGGAVTMTDAQVSMWFSELFSDERQLEEKTRSKGSLFRSNGRLYRVSTF